jgi:FkbM family methyltransferase
MNRKPDTELRLLIGLSRRFPRIRGFGWLAHLIQHFYIRRHRKRLQVDVLGFEMDLDPMESIDGYLLFAPQIYDYREFRLLAQLLRPGDTFLDAGANIGIYSLTASQLVTQTGCVIAVDASSFNAACLRRNCELNQITNVNCVHAGLSDKHEELTLACSDYGNKGGNSFLTTSNITEQVKCLPLLDLLTSVGVTKVDGVKIDIEGFEFRVLSKYIKLLDPDLLPGFFIFEHNEAFDDRSGGDVRHLLEVSGYTVSPIWDQNYLATRRSN